MVPTLSFWGRKEAYWPSSRSDGDTNGLERMNAWPTCGEGSQAGTGGSDWHRQHNFFMFLVHKYNFLGCLLMHQFYEILALRRLFKRIKEDEPFCRFLLLRFYFYQRHQTMLDLFFIVADLNGFSKTKSIADLRRRNAGNQGWSSNKRLNCPILRRKRTRRT